jgi:hypothetical protein
VAVSRSIVVYARYHTTSYIFIHVLARMLAGYRATFRDVHVHLVLDDRRDVDVARRLLPADRVTIWAQYADMEPFEPSAEWSEETIRRWERLYGVPHLRAYIANERAVRGRPEAVKWGFLLSHVEYFETLWEKTRPTLFVSGPADGLSPWVALTVFQANGTACVSFSPSRFGSRSFILDNPYETLHVGPLYREMLRRGLTPEALESARALREQYRRGAVLPMPEAAARRRRRRRVPNPLSVLRLIREARYTDAGKFALPLRPTLERAARARMTGLRNVLLRGRTLAAVPEGEPFFFFPLQYEPETSLETQGRGWWNQLEVIRWISQSLPIDRWLYVKEHPLMLSGIRPAGFYRTILSLPRVRLLDQRLRGDDVSRRAEAVLTITGTAGWEGLMWGRPVALFGHAFYEEFEEGVVRVERPDELPRILRSFRDREVPEEPLLAYIAAVLARTPEGIFIEPRTYPDAAGVVLGERNLDAIADVILQRWHGGIAEGTEA